MQCYNTHCHAPALTDIKEGQTREGEVCAMLQHSLSRSSSHRHERRPDSRGEKRVQCYNTHCHAPALTDMKEGQTREGEACAILQHSLSRSSSHRHERRPDSRREKRVQCYNTHCHAPALTDMKEGQTRVGKSVCNATTLTVTLQLSQT